MEHDVRTENGWARIITLNGVKTYLWCSDSATEWTELTGDEGESDMMAEIQSAMRKSA